MAVLLPFQRAPKTPLVLGLLEHLTEGSLHSLLPFFHSCVFQIRTDTLAPDTAPSPGGVHTAVRETDRHINSFISVLPGRVFWPGLP